MAEVQWIKIYLDMFDKPKIKKVRRLPAGNDLLLIWVMLLVKAGKCNAGGMIYITERFPYTEEDLAEELGFDVNTIRLALKAFEEFDMISTSPEGFIDVLGWEEHQNVDKLAEIREQTRKRVAKCREKKMLSQGSVTSNVTVTQGNAIEVDIDKEKDIDIYTTTTTSDAPPLTEVFMYFSEVVDGDAAKESEKFHAYNAKRGWDCMPDWKAAADLWMARIGEERRTYDAKRKKV
jgi:predicted phage replisome organizer